MEEKRDAEKEEFSEERAEVHEETRKSSLIGKILRGSGLELFWLEHIFIASLLNQI